MLMMQRWQERRGGQRGPRERCACAELTAHRVDQVAGGVEAGHLEEVDHRRLDRDLGLFVHLLAVVLESPLDHGFLHLLFGFTFLIATPGTLPIGFHCSMITILTL